MNIWNDVLPSTGNCIAYLRRLGALVGERDHPQLYIFYLYAMLSFLRQLTHDLQATLQLESFLVEIPQ